MKKFLLLLILPAFFACSEDDGNAVQRQREVSAADLVGTWHTVKTVNAFGEENINEGCPDPNGGDGNGSKVYTFQEDNNFDITYQCTGLMDWEGQYTVTGNVLKFIVQDNSETYTIESYSDSEMVLRLDYNDPTPMTNYRYMQRQVAE